MLIKLECGYLINPEKIDVIEERLGTSFAVVGNFHFPLKAKELDEIKAYHLKEIDHSFFVKKTPWWYIHNPESNSKNEQQKPFTVQDIPKKEEKIKDDVASKHIERMRSTCALCSRKNSFVCNSCLQKDGDLITMSFFKRIEL